MMTAIGELTLAQEDGGLPTTLAAGSAPGESGVCILSVRFRGGAHFSATPRQHLIWFQMSSQVRFQCRIGGRALRHEPPAGSLAICPAGVDCAADAEASVDAVLVAIHPGHLALAAAEELALEARLVDRLSGRDQALLDLARTLASESADGYPCGFAIELVRDGRSSLAEIAARTGFADQSHLSRWARRVHGVSLTQLAA